MGSSRSLPVKSFWPPGCHLGESPSWDLDRQRSPRSTADLLFSSSLSSPHGDNTHVRTAETALLWSADVHPRSCFLYPTRAEWLYPSCRRQKWGLLQIWDSDGEPSTPLAELLTFLKRKCTVDVTKWKAAHSGMGWKTSWTVFRVYTLSFFP